MARKKKKDEAAKVHRAKVQRIWQRNDHLLIYTDGSQREVSGVRRVGAAAVAYCGGREIKTLAYGMGEDAEVYDGELAALMLESQFATIFAKDHPNFAISTSLLTIPLL
ncbi:hypothetical protein EV121DRAFT_297226 [Schizophyllum commune]